MNSIQIRADEKVKISFKKETSNTIDFGSRLSFYIKSKIEYVVFNLKGYLLVIRFNLDTGTGEIRNLIRLSGFGQLSAIYNMFYTWDWGLDKSRSKAADEEVRAWPWVSGEQIRMSGQFSTMQQFQKYFTVEQKYHEDTIAGIKNSSELKEFIVTVLTHFDVIYPSSYQDQEVQKFLNYEKGVDAKKETLNKNTIFKRCALSKISNSFVLSSDRVLSFKIEFSEDSTCVVQAYSLKLQDIGYFYIVPSKKYIYRISPSLYIDLQNQPNVERVSDHILAQQIARKVVREKILALEIQTASIVVKNAVDTILNLNLSNLEVQMSQIYNVLSLNIEISQINVSFKNMTKIYF